MKTLLVTAALLLSLPALTPAQEVDRPPRGQGYIFIGAATHQLGATAGFGGEFYTPSVWAAASRVQLSGSIVPPTAIPTGLEWARPT